MTPRRRPLHRRGTAAVVLVIGALALTACASGGPSGGASGVPTRPVSIATPTTRPSGLVGPTWRVVHVKDGTVDADVPTMLGATVSLHSDGSFVDDDSVNTVSGHYDLTASGFVPSDAVSTAVGSVGTDAVQSATIDAIGAVCNGDEVAATVDGGALTLQVGATVIELRTSS